jgi:hypothetical protein
MAELLSFPLRLGSNGAFVTRNEDDSAYYAELLGVLIATREGERPYTPTFGMRDPTFTKFDAQELAAKVELFGPPVRIVSVNEEAVSSTEVDVTVEFTPLEAEGQAVNLDEL